MLRIWIILVLTICSLNRANGRQSPIPQSSFQHILDDLASSQIETIIQDSYGFIWLGTTGGLHKYDGYGFEVFPKKTPEISGLKSRSILCLYEDKNKDLWVGTRAGLSKFDRKSNRFISCTVELSSDVHATDDQNWIRDVKEDQNGTLWVTSESKGLFYRKKNSEAFEPFPVGNKEGQINSRRTNALVLDQSGNLWVSTFDHGIYLVDVNVFQAEKLKLYDENLNKQELVFGWTLACDEQNNIWLGTKGYGLFKIRLDEGKGFSRHYTAVKGDLSSLGNNEVYDLFVDSQNRVWIGNENGGLHVYDGTKDKFIRYQHDEKNPTSLSQNSIRCVYEDAQKRIWIGTSFQGVDIYDQNHSKFKHYVKSESNSSGLNNNIVRDFYEDPSGKVWVATDGGGINVWNRKTDEFEHYKYDAKDDKSIGSDAILGFCEDADGSIWVSGWGAGLNKFYDPKKGHFKHYMYEGFVNNFPRNHFFQIIRDSQDNLWCANFGAGLLKYDWDSKEFSLFKDDPEDTHWLNTNMVTVLLEDHQGALWIGTEQFGVYKMMGKNSSKPYFEPFLKSDVHGIKFKSEITFDIVEDSKYNIWIGTDRGLYKVKPGEEEIELLDISHGLSSNAIKSIVEDDHGFLWLGTNRGLCRLNPQTNEIDQYHTTDGLQSNEFSRYAAMKLTTGELIFGGTNGFNVFHPDSLYGNKSIPPVYLTSFKIFNHEVSPSSNDSPLSKHISMTDTIVLNHTQSVFSFEFSALNYTRSENNQYAFMLEGLEEDWNYVGTDRKASYSNLDPGEYLFRVKAANNDGIWNEKGLLLTVIMLPPWWQTWWFKMFLVVLIVSVFLIILIVRTSYLNKQRKLLKRTVHERTTELEMKNERIEMQAEELQVFNDALNELNEKLESTVEERTNELLDKNEKLAEYAFINAHNLRVPVANVKGIIQLLNQNRPEEETNELIHLLKGQSDRLDDVLLEIQRMLERDKLMQKEAERSIARQETEENFVNPKG